MPERPKARQTGVCAYLRVSSASQTAEMQRHAIEQAAETAGELVARWFHDPAMSGGGRRPPALLDLLDAARLGKVRKLYVYRLDRLGRRGIRDLLSLVHELESLNVELVSLADGFTLGGPAREVILAVLAWAAQMERLAIGERIRAARERIEAKGGRWGRPRRMTPSQEREVVKLASSGQTHRQIAVALKVPRSTLQRFLAQKPLRKTGGKRRSKRAA